MDVTAVPAPTHSPQREPYSMEVAEGWVRAWAGAEARPCDGRSDPRYEDRRGAC